MPVDEGLLTNHRQPYQFGKAVKTEDFCLLGWGHYRPHIVLKAINPIAIRVTTTQVAKAVFLVS